MEKGMPYLITYSQKEKKGPEIFANYATRETPAEWLLNTVKKYPEISTTLYFAIEITESELLGLCEEIL
jgi:hypothetical protein